MKLGVCSSVYGELKIEDALDRFQSLGIENVEIHSGGDGIKPHMNVPALLSSETERQKYMDMFKKRNISIGSLNASGNPVHPVEEVRKKAHDGFVRTVCLAEKLGIDTVVVFSGTPGGSPKDETPNWVTCPWPNEYSDILEYQWNDVLIPYWRKAASIARDHGIAKIGIEMHPGFCVYNPETLLKLRANVADEIGSNFDSSHLMWQGMDASSAAIELKDCIYSVHAKDVSVNDDYIRRNGVNDGKRYSDILNRAWTFRTVGFGHGYEMWNKLISTLCMIGYDGNINLEHEDALFSRSEGLEKASRFMAGIIRRESSEDMWWA